MASVTIRSDFGTQENKVCHHFHSFPVYLSWSAGAKCHELPFFECWVLSQLVHSSLSLSSRASLVPLQFLPWGWCHLLLWGYWYCSQQSWFQLVLHPAQHFAQCVLHISSISRVKYAALSYSFPNFEPVHCSMSSSNCCFLTCIQTSQDGLIFPSLRIFHSLLWST